ncbi:MAG: hypothetical protein ACTTJ7_02660 [Treponema sp.]
MKNARKYLPPFMVCMALFCTVLLPCSAQEAVGTDDTESAAQAMAPSSGSEAEYQADDDEFSDDLEDDFSAEPVLMVSGSIETLHGLRWNKGLEYGASRSITRVKGEVYAGASYAVISAAAEYNHRNPAHTGFRLDEAYYRYSDDSWDISAGRQVIAWGQADGFKLTDVLSARDGSEFTALSGEDARLPSDSIRLRFFHDLFTFEAVAVPFFTPNKLPPFDFESNTKESLYYISTPKSVPTPMGTMVPVRYTKTDSGHSFRFEDTDAAARFSFFLPGVDFSISGFYGLDKTPAFLKRGSIKGALSNPAQPFHPLRNPFIPKSGSPALEMRLDPYYYHIGMAGCDAAISVGEVTIRLESAWIGGRKFEPKKETLVESVQFSPDSMIYLFKPAIKKHQLLMLAGVDWLKDSWTLSAQYFEDLILNHANDIERSMHKGFVSLNLGKMFLRDTLKLSVSGVIDVNYGSTFSTCSIDYALTDNLHIALGQDFYTQGYQGGGEFAGMSGLNTLWLKGTFIFSR